MNKKKLKNLEGYLDFKKNNIEPIVLTPDISSRLGLDNDRIKLNDILGIELVLKCYRDGEDIIIITNSHQLLEKEDLNHDSNIIATYSVKGKLIQKQSIFKRVFNKITSVFSF